MGCIRAKRMGMEPRAYSLQLIEFLTQYTHVIWLSLKSHLYNTITVVNSR